jgi:hypothetical protein
MAGIHDLIRRYADGGPTVTSQADFQNQWDTLKGQTDPTAVAQRQALNAAFNTYQTNQNVQGLYGLNQTNADTFLKDASAGLAPLTTGQNPNTQTYTPDAFSTMTGFEQALSSNPTGANTLMQSFTGTGSNPLLGQYNVLPSPTGTQGAILPYQNGVATPGMAGISALAKALSAKSSAAPAANTITAAKTDLGSLKNYGITNPALISYITSTPGLTDNDLKNLASVYNSKTAQQIAVAQQADDPLHVIANAMVSHDATVKERLTDPKSYIYNQGNVPVYRPASQSTNAVGDVFTTKFGGIISQEPDRNGYVHITSAGKDYTINPKSNRIISINPAGTYQPYGSASPGYNNMASGGSVQMPNSYSQGNWKLI